MSLFWYNNCPFSVYGRDWGDLVPAFKPMVLQDRCRTLTSKHSIQKIVLMFCGRSQISSWREDLVRHHQKRLIVNKSQSSWIIYSCFLRNEERIWSCKNRRDLAWFIHIYAASSIGRMVKQKEIEGKQETNCKNFCSKVQKRCKNQYLFSTALKDYSCFLRA